MDDIEKLKNVFNEIGVEYEESDITDPEVDDGKATALYVTNNGSVVFSFGFYKGVLESYE